MNHPLQTAKQATACTVTLIGFDLLDPYTQILTVSQIRPFTIVFAPLQTLRTALCGRPVETWVQNLRNASMSGTEILSFTQQVSSCRQLIQELRSYPLP